MASFVERERLSYVECVYSWPVNINERCKPKNHSKPLCPQKVREFLSTKKSHNIDSIFFIWFWARHLAMIIHSLVFESFCLKYVFRTVSLLLFFWWYVVYSNKIVRFISWLTLFYHLEHCIVFSGRLRNR